MRILRSIRSTHIFLGIYITVILGIFGLSSAAMSLAHEKVGLGPYAIGLLFFRVVPLLMWSIPLVMAALSGWAFGNYGFPKASAVTRRLAAALIAVLYSGLGIALIFGTYNLIYPK